MKNLAITMYRFPGVKADVYERNVRSFRDHNPEAHIDCMTAADFADPTLRRISNKWRSAWRHSDKVLYDLYRRKPNFEWYLYSEWDVFCNIELSKMIDPVKGYQVLAHKIFYQDLDCSSGWLQSEKRFMSPDTHQYMAQTAPLAGVAVHNTALERIAAPHALHSSGTFCEVRLATLARIYGLSLAQYPRYSDKLWVSGLTPARITGEGLWHPVKFLVP